MSKNISQDILDIIEKTLTSCGVELYDVEYKGKILRVQITKPEGITIDNCTTVSQALSQNLDRANLIPTRYFLEVSSPGIERRLRNKYDFEQSIENIVMIRTKAGNFIGKLLSTSETGINIKNIAGSSLKAGTEQFITYSEINFARIVKSDEELFNKNISATKNEEQKVKSRKGSWNEQ